MGPKHTRPLHIRLSKAAHAVLTDAADESSLSFSEYMRCLIDFYLAKYGRVTFETSIKSKKIKNRTQGEEGPQGAKVG